MADKATSEIEKKRKTLEEKRAEILKKKEEANKRAKELQAQLSALDKKAASKNKKARTHGLIVLGAMFLSEAHASKATYDAVLKRLKSFSDKDQESAKLLISELGEFKPNQTPQGMEIKPQ